MIMVVNWLDYTLAFKPNLDYLSKYIPILQLVLIEVLECTILAPITRLFRHSSDICADTSEFPPCSHRYIRN